MYVHTLFPDTVVSLVLSSDHTHQRLKNHFFFFLRLVVASPDRSSYDIDLLASRILRLRVANHEIQRGIVVTRIVVLANVPVVQPELFVHFGGHDSVVVVRRNEHLVLPVKSDLSGLRWSHRSELCVGNVGCGVED